MTDEAPEFDLERAWARLSLQLQWADSFWLGFVFVDDARVSETLCDRANQQLAEEGKRLSRFAPAKPEAIDDLVIDLLAGEAGDVAWLDLVRHDDGARAPGWENAWTRVLMRLNERREALRRRFSTGGVVLVTTRDRMLRTPETAPDLWSIRAWSLAIARVGAGLLRSREVGEFALFGTREEARSDLVEEARQSVTRARAMGHSRRLLGALLTLAGAEEGEPARLALNEAEQLLDTLDPSRSLADLRVHLQIGHLWYAIGKTEEAEARIRHMIEIARGLGDSPSIRAVLASGLHGLGVVLGKRGLTAEAFDVTREAHEIRRALTRVDPASYLADLAYSQYNLAIDLSELGRLDESLNATREALNLSRVLASRQPDRYLDLVAKNLGNLGLRLVALQRYDEALVASRESTSLFRMLVSARPIEFSGDLAQSLTNLALLLGDLARWEEACDMAREAIEILRREEARTGPRPPLGNALGALGAILAAAGQLEQALAISEEAVRMTLRLGSSREIDHLVQRLADDYRRACAAAGREPAEDLAPILARLEG